MSGGTAGRGAPAWIGRAGWAGFAFFLLKGLGWLAALGLAAGSASR